MPPESVSAELPSPNFVVLGAGFTGLRVVRLLQASGHQVRWTNHTRGDEGAVRFDARGTDFSSVCTLITPETTVLHSIPTLRTQNGLAERTPVLMQALSRQPPARVVYLSTTGVYGSATIVNERTAPAPETDRERLRVAAEDAVRGGRWSSLILRPAAIYGPGRGIHSAMRARTYRLPEQPSNFVSRIHVDDLAAHAYAGLFSSIQGSYPVADEEPCTSLEAASLCAGLLGIPLPERVPMASLGETRRADRRVDGSAVRRLLHVTLRYPTYRVGFPACLAAEERDRSMS